MKVRSAVILAALGLALWLLSPLLGSARFESLARMLSAFACSFIVLHVASRWFAWLEHPERLHNVSHLLPAFKGLSSELRREKVAVLIAANPHRLRAGRLLHAVVSIGLGFALAAAAVASGVALFDLFARSLGSNLRSVDGIAWAVLPLWLLASALLLKYIFVLQLRDLLRWTRPELLGSGDDTNFICRACGYRLVDLPNQLHALLEARARTKEEIESLDSSVRLVDCPECGCRNAWWSHHTKT